MIEIINLTKKYGKKEILKNISLSFDKDTYGLLGPNGAGKTTLIRILAGILPYNSGTITYSDSKIGYLPQKFGCFPEFTLYEQLEYFSYLKELPKNTHKTEINRVLELTNLEEYAKIKCSKLSGGMIRRTGIAQALLGNPNLLLLDEPTVGLDPEERIHFHNTIQNLHGKSTILLSTHIVEDVKSLCKNIIIMDKGTIIINENIQEIISIVNKNTIKIECEDLENAYLYFIKRFDKQ